MKHHADLGKQAVGGAILHILPAHQHRTLLYIPETGDQVTQGGLAAAGGSHDGAGRALGDVQRNAVYDHAAVVGEGYVPQLNIRGAGPQEAVGAVQRRNVGDHLQPVQLIVDLACQEGGSWSPAPHTPGKRKPGTSGSRKAGTLYLNTARLPETKGRSW